MTTASAPVGRWRAGHDGRRLSWEDFDGEVFRSGTCLDFGDYFKVYREMCEVAGTHSVAIPHRTPERRKITVREDRFCQNPAGACKQLLCFHLAGTYLGGVPLHKAASVFKAQDCGLLWEGGHLR